jgi:rhodanese-related sulfurtransferase
MEKYFKKIKFQTLLPFVFGFLGVIVGVYLTKYIPVSENERRKEFYETEMSVSVSPATLKKWVDDKNTDYILVDLRSAGEFEKEHFITAVNVPATSMNEEQLVEAFKKLDLTKTIVVHCYSAYCTLGREVGETLAKNKIFVKELNVGWSELRYHWDIWNPGAKVTDGEKYIIKGTPSSVITPCTQGKFGC